MYLSLLNTEQKKLFLSIAYDLASSDMDFSESERQVIDGYSMEMKIEFKMEEIDKYLNRFINNINQTCGKREKKIIIFEMIGLAMADSNYDDNEREIIKKALTLFGLETNFGKYCEKKLIEYFNLQNELNTYILS